MSSSSPGTPEDEEAHSSVCTVCLRLSVVMHSSPVLSHSSLRSSPTVASLVSQERGIDERTDGGMGGRITLYRKEKHMLWRGHFGAANALCISPQTAHPTHGLCVFFPSTPHEWLL
ncbi:hypothetical protein LDENG_00281150 [Lucifuga dentata]|nr:hypothetical protein LDENG_00281150 [Lucifuga dentata]